jgi:mitochondrial cardiolipin hydrolase
MRKLLFPAVMILLIFALFSSEEGRAEVVVLFSPEGEIKGALIAEIESSRATIDAAIHQIESTEIAQALSTARQRGVRVRVIADGKLARSRSSRITYLVTQGVLVKVLKGKEKGAMNHRFALFDGRKVMTGSYDWAEGADKMNHENVVLSDDKEVVAPFQTEFDRLWRETRTIK